MNKEYAIFISYRRDTGKDFALHLKEGLEREGIHAFLDVVDIPQRFKKDEWWRYRDEALLHSRLFLLIMTDSIQSSDEVGKEISLAKEAKKDFMLLRNQGVERDIVINFEDSKLHLGCYPQIDFETKEGLLRKVLRNLSKEKSKESRRIARGMGREESFHGETVKSLWKAYRNPFSSTDDREMALEKLIKLNTFEKLRAIVDCPWESDNNRKKAFKALTENPKENESFLLYIVRNVWYNTDFRTQAREALKETEG